MFQRTQVVSGENADRATAMITRHVGQQNRFRADAKAGVASEQPNTRSSSGKHPATAARTAPPGGGRVSPPSSGGHAPATAQHAEAGHRGARWRRLAIVAMPMTPPSAGAVPRLAGLLHGYRPDRVLVLCPHTSQEACALGDETGCCHDVITLLHQAHPCLFDLQRPHAPKRGGRAPTRGAVTAGRRPCGSQPHLRMVPPLHQPAPGWVSICTHTPTASSHPGARAVEHSRTLGQSVVVNGTSLALVGETTTDDRGTQRTLWGLEVASFAAASSNRNRLLSSGLGALEIDESGVQPRTVWS